ncbi:hypothetical protein JTE90_006757 [Oedothorax gibbosus]|uniref:Probable aminopeptidase NPEPL1 N-terminal domain-containing protein n=1 Tax=Oedothorax gibbosus TaxID=931172 RepID=A0AAV6UJA2_9ARAC|nr:hypothetical protein JTE90_006757 [Oedothorax gibbosus]
MVRFSTEITPSDPQEQSVLLVGQKCYLDFLDNESVKPKIGTRVTEELYEKALSLVKGNTESVPLYLKYATLARLPNVCSRHNTPSQAHTLAKLVKAHMGGGRDGFIVVACDYRDILASACAIARCFPLYSKKQRDTAFTITVNFIVMDPCKVKGRIMEDDIDCLNAAAMGVRLSARIVDMPCSEMHTDAFIQEICKVGDMLNIKPVIINPFSPNDNLALSF